ncbi:MAG TPA: LecA/PA-IL family lectin, partial [Blastocatellia bacterium]
IGNVSVFELRGLPNKDNSDMLWDPKDMRARIAVNFRIVDTTTGVVELSNEMTGQSPQGPKTNAGGRIGKNIIGGMIGGSKAPEVKDEQIRDVVGQAVDEVINSMTGDVQKFLSGALRPPEPAITTDKLINGRVISVNGPSVIITNVNKSAVRVGDRLFVRRFTAVRDETTGKSVSFSEKVGEVEVVEIQDQVIIGSFAGSGVAKAGDTVTNSPTGVGLPIDPVRETRSSPPPAPTTAPPPQQVAAPQTHQATAPQVQPVATSQTQQLQVQANRNWNDTGIDVQPGKQLELVATGLVKISPTREVPPAGLVNRPAPATLPLPGANIGALVARICHPDGQCLPVQLVGARIILSPGKAGRLMLGVNDSEVTDNSGYFTVTVR